MKRGEMVYQPMGEKPLVPESRMREILAKHKKVPDGQQPESNLGPVAGDPAVQPGVVGDPEVPRLLAWEKPVGTGVRTTCGRFSCAKLTVDGKTQYELWRVAPGGNWFTCVRSQMSSYAEVKQLAEDTLREKP